MAYRFSQEIIVNQSREDTAEAYTNIESFKKWFRNTAEVVHLTPDLTDIGAKFLLKGNMDSKAWEGVMEIENKEIPSLLKWNWNTDNYNDRITTRFVVESENQTRVTCDHKLEFFGFFTFLDSFRLKALKSQYERDLKMFKDLIEN